MQSVETANELYKTGKANYIEVLLAQQNSLQNTIRIDWYKQTPALQL